MIVGETFEDERVADLVVYSDTAMNLRSTVVSSKRRSKAWKAALIGVKTVAATSV